MTGVCCGPCCTSPTTKQRAQNVVLTNASFRLPAFCQSAVTGSLGGGITSCLFLQHLSDVVGVAKAQNLPKSVAGNGAPSVFAAFMPHDIETLAKIVIGSQGYTPQCPCNPDGSLGLKDKVSLRGCRLCV